MSTTPPEIGEAHDTRADTDGARFRTAAEWLMLAWVLFWSWAYVQSALAERFPGWFGWTTRLW